MKYDFLKNLELKTAFAVKSEVEVHEKERAITHFITTPDMDWGNHTVDPKGMDARMFQKHGTVFFNHNYNLPIASNMWLKSQEDGGLAKTRFAKTDFAEDTYQMHKDGIIKTWSIGWQPTHENGKVKKGALEFDEDKQILHIKMWDLVEYSSAPLAMNPSAIDQIKTFAKADETLQWIEHLEGKNAVNQALITNQEEIKSIYKLIEQQKGLIQESDTRLEVLEAEIKDLQEMLNKIKNSVKEETVEILGKSIDVDAIVAREISRLSLK